MTLQSLNFLSFESRTRNPLAFPLFTVFIALHPLAAFAIIKLFFPETWAAQVSAGPVAIILTTMACNLVFCFGEYLFHRYLLHANSISFLGRLSFGHLHHHKLTFLGQPVGHVNRCGKSRNRQHEADDVGQGQRGEFKENQRRLTVANKLIKQAHGAVDPIDPDQNQ